MSSFVNVQVRVLAAQALAQLAAIESRINGLERGMGRAGRSANFFSSSLNTARLDAFGSRIQWVGRQIEYNFTLPILAAAGASMYLALQNEKAFKRIEKVYGDATHGSDMYAKELTSLKSAFKALSNEFGVNQTEVIEIGAAWAAAGASGLALAKSVKLTMQTMILGELEAAEATEALIAIQAQYGQNVGELTKTIATLNSIENETGISLKGLIEGFSRAAGVARDAGVDVRHLGAMLAALTPAAGSAAQAGNAVKTILSRLVAPTQETVEVLRLMGVETSNLAWKSTDATGKLAILAESFNKLDKAQRNVVSSVIASRWQVNKFSVLMRELTNENGYYQKALRATNDEHAVFVQMNKELETVLKSNPRRLQILWSTIQNAAADIITPMIPLLLWLATAVAKVVTAFSELNPGLQKLIVIGLLVLAAIGPLIRLSGALVLLFAQLAAAAGWLIAPFAAVARVMYAFGRIQIIGFFLALSRVMNTVVVAAVWRVAAAFTRLGGHMAIALLKAATIAGIAWRAGSGVLVTGILGTVAAIGVIWRRMVAFIWTASIALFRTLGIIWRTGLAAIFLIQRAWGLLMMVSWRAFFVGLAALVARGLGAIVALFRAFIPVMRMLSAALLAAMTGPWGIAIGAILFLIVAFWDELKSLWKVIVEGTINAFNSLPQGIASAMRAVVTIVQRAAMAVYNAFSWMNPWARHSPSLVDNVRTGVAEIRKQYSTLDDVASIIRRAGMGMREFANLLAKLKRAAEIQEIKELRRELSQIGPGSLPTFDKLVKALFPLRDLLKKIGDQIDRQQKVVDKWKTKLDNANKAIEQQEKKLDKLREVAENYQKQLNAAQAELDRFASAPIVGMREMDDAIFENEMSQKRLRLEMLKIEEAVGPLDELRDRLGRINGEMELLRGEQSDLRSAGAGSEILGQYDEQIRMLEEQKNVINEQVKPIQDLADQIDELGRRAERLDLERSLKFDPLTRQIDQLVNSMEELPFDQILAGVIANKAEVDRLTEAYDKATAAVDQQQDVVDRLTEVRDKLQERYDKESEKLQKLREDYELVENQVRAIETALNDMASAARAAARAAEDARGGGGGRMSPGAKNFLDAEGGNFPDPGGFAQIGREGGWGDQSKMIDEFTKEMTDKTKNMFGMFNFLDPIKKAWNTAWGWVKENVGGPIGDVVSSIKSKLGNANPIEGLSSWWETAKEVGKGIKDAMKMIWDFIGPEVIEIGKQAWAGLKDAFADIQPEVKKFRDLVGPMGEALGNLWKILKPVLAVVLGLILTIVKALLGAIGGAIGPFIRGIGDLIAGVIKIIRGIITFVVGVFTGDWEKAWEGIKDIFSGIWQAIWGVIKNFVNMIWGAIKGFFQSIWDAAKWLWKELVGNSIIPDIVNGITAWFKKLVQWGKDLWNKLVDGLKKVWDTFWNWVKTKLDTARNNISSGINTIRTTATNAWNTLRDNLKSAWDWVWDKVKAKIDWGRGQISSAMDKIKAAFTSLKNAWNTQVEKIRELIDSMVKKFNNIKSRFSFGGMFDGIKSAFRSAINWVIGKWNNLSFPAVSVGGVQLTPSIGTPNIPYLAQGAKVTRATLAMIGEGRKGYPEYVIPTDPMHRRRAMALMNQLTRDMGYSLGGATQVVNHTEKKEFHFHGDMSFPNVKSGDDAETFISNLESLAGGSGRGGGWM